MGYRWYEGRLLSDDEYSAERDAGIVASLRIVGFLIPFGGLASLGAYLYEAPGSLISFVIGGIIGYVFNSFLAILARWIIIIAIIAAIVGVLALFIWG